LICWPTAKLLTAYAWRHLMNEKTKRCPYCGEEILEIAIKCKHCSSMLAEINGGAALPSTRPLITKLARSMVLGSNRYELKTKLGTGGMGVVYRALDRQLNIDVALKVLPPDIANNPRTLETLKEEARLTMQLAHPNVMRLYNYEDDGKYAFLVMEYIEGMTLNQEMDLGGKMSVARIEALLPGICEGLQYAHNQDLLHRDLKPSNIMVVKDGSIRICDFGIARHLKDSVSQTAGKEISGTLLYMSPEQLRGNPCDQRSDIYSLGVLLYELFSGKPPFTTGNIALQILNETPPPIEGINERWTLALAKCLAKSPDERFWQVSQLHEAITRTESVITVTEEQEQPEPEPVVIKSQSSSLSIREEKEINLPGGVKIELILIPAGKFMMGSPPDEFAKDKSEHLHEVEISRDFWLGKYPVTQEQWRALMSRTPSVFSGEKLPVEGLFWNDCQEYIEALNKVTGGGMRLPTDAEWEYACRAGSTTPFCFGDKITTRLANYDGNFTYGDGEKGGFLERTTEVGAYPPNPWGLYDMHGNISEWCQDYFNERYYWMSPPKDPTGPSSGNTWVLRGGNWRSHPKYCRSAYRTGIAPGRKHGLSGFRIAGDV
jgi:formylglycine-generating enzyme required for sulfatase activity/predicted Ser/Thr protein kinase